MASLNKVMLIGNLTRDSELKYLPSGSAILEFRLAVSRKFKKADGTDGEETCFVDVSLWGKRGEAVAQYLTKGKPLFVEGRLKLDEWEDKESGAKRSKLTVVAENIEFLGGRSDGAGGGERAGGASYTKPSSAGNSTARMTNGANGRAASGDSRPYPSGPGATAVQVPDEDIPF